MDKLIIEGGHPLCGEIAISGAKNAALPIICASLLSKEPLHLDNVPRLHDVATMLNLLAQMGVNIEHIKRSDNNTSEPSTLLLDAAGLNQPQAPYDLVKTMRAAILVLGPLLARYGEAKVSLPGDCTAPAFVPTWSP